jgi:ATP-dependent helicase Lhr and Lhr-like helicase
VTGPAASHLHPAVVHHVVNTLGWQSLRPMQEAAIEPLTTGDDALLVAPTAGGKTEAAAFPLLSAMASGGWSGLSVLYVCPLKALLNNLEPRLATYLGWLGRRVGLWHGDTAASARSRMLADPPDLLLTTPESLEAMLVSTRVNPRAQFADVRAVVVDEVHAFAGDDRGWHLLAVLERAQRLAGRPLQRVGLSATVGNPDELLRWLQGSGAGHRPARVVAPEAGANSDPPAEVILDHVGSLDNAAVVLSKLHRGEKRLAFCESRRQVEDLTIALRARGVTTFVSHSSLPVDERRRAEAAFADARDCVIVSTSTLELGVDVGDLDRVVQIDAPLTVASFLQRLGRGGRRPGTVRNALFLSTSQDSLVQAAGVLSLWRAGWVEPVKPPPSPRHILAQQLLALCLQEHRVGDRTWTEWLPGLAELFDSDRHRIVDWLIDSGHLEREAGMLFVGPEAERRYGRRHFMELVSVFTAQPEFRVVSGRQEVGTVDTLTLAAKVDGPRLIALGGRTWRVAHIDWRRRRCWVEPAEGRGRTRWQGQPRPMSFQLCRSRREVLLGSDPGVQLTRRASDALDSTRAATADRVTADGTVVDTANGAWWTWAGARANAALEAAFPDLVDAHARRDNDRVRLRDGVTRSGLAELGADPDEQWFAVPDVEPEAVRGLKFAESLPPDLAAMTLGERFVDADGALVVLAEPRLLLHRDSQ